MAIKQAIKFIRMRGRIIPIRVGNKLGKIPKVRYHQTDIKSAESIKKTGFHLKKTTHGKDSLPRGVFTKRSDKLIPLKGKTQIPVLDLTKKTKVFRDRKDFESFGIISDNSIGKLHSKSMELDRVMNKSFDKLMSNVGKQRHAIIKKTGDKAKGRLVMGKVSRLLHRWKSKQDNIMTSISKKNLDLLKSQGYDSMELVKDTGGFGKVTDTKIIFDPSKVKPFKKFLNIKRRKK